MELDRLKAFRQAAYQYLGKARDATFELTDAVLLTRTAYCLADLSLSPVFRRHWPSIQQFLTLCSTVTAMSEPIFQVFKTD
jgi:hypothetical protein